MANRVHRLTINGEDHEILAPAHWTLLEVLRYKMKLTGTKQGCDKGDCGACTVLADGEPILSCCTLSAMAEGRNIQTIEGLGSAALLHPVQQAMHEQVAAQCGYCTPGIALCLASLLDREATPNEAQLREALASNICRCTGYTKILDAARQAIAARRSEGGE